MEDWKPVKGLEDRYAISSIGRLKRTAPGKKTYPGKILATPVSGTGYASAHLGYGRDRKTRNVHRMVAEAFLPPPEDAAQCYVAHKNGNPSDNRVENLYWARPAENSHDQFLHKRSKGVSDPNRKRLTDDDVRAIRADARKLVDIAKDYGLTSSAVGRIRRGQAHKHVPPSPDDIGAVTKARIFTPEQIREIRRSQEPNSVVARKLEVSANTIRDIRNGKFYRWVDDTDVET